jgi:hypothetical protein
MATIKMQGNASGSGSVTLTAPNTNSARTVTLPDEDIDLGNIGGAGSVEAWVTYNMGGTPSIIADGGVSSITDLGVGTPQFNLDTALSAANGTLWNNCGYYGSVGSEIPVQGGGRVSSTTTWKAYCGSNGTTRVDWVEGYSGLIR